MLTRIILCWFLSNVFFTTEAVIKNQVAEGITKKYMAAILKRSTNLIHCGGTIVLADVVVTSCWCVHENPNKLFPTKNLYVVSGTLNIKSEYKQNSEFKKFLPHPQCNASVLPPRADVALAFLEKPFKLSDFFKPVRFVSKIKQSMWWWYDRLSSINRICETPGWGISSLAPNVFPPVELRFGPVKLMPPADCKRLACEIYNYCVPDMTVYHQSCALPFKGSTICSGDQGGPLTCNDDFYGVISWGPPGCESHIQGKPHKLYPIFFCDPNTVLQFIRENVPKFNENVPKEKEVRSKVPPTKYPFVVNIANISNERIPVSLCAGSILTKKDILTTCSCMKQLKFDDKKGYYKDVDVIFGKINLFLSAENEQRLKIKEVALDNSCEILNGTVYYDIAIAIVNGEFSFKEKSVQPVRLKTTNIEVLKQALSDLQLKSKCVMPTWGYSIESPTQIRYHVFAEWNVQVFHIESCLDEFCDIDTPLCNETITDREETCGRAYDPKLPCFADIGAPLICDGYFFGVVSHIGGLCWSGNKIKIVTAMTVLDLVLKKYPDFKLEREATSGGSQPKPNIPGGSYDSSQGKNKHAQSSGNQVHLCSIFPLSSFLVLVAFRKLFSKLSRN